MEIRDRIMISHRQRAEQKYVSMCQAAGEGDVEQVLSLVRHGVDIDKPNHDGRTILHMAADKGNYAMVEALLQHRANRDAVDRWGSTPLFLAMQGKHTTVIGLLTASNATLSLKNPSAELCTEHAPKTCTAASAGDLLTNTEEQYDKIDPMHHRWCMFSFAVVQPPCLFPISCPTAGQQAYPRLQDSQDQ